MTLVELAELLDAQYDLVYYHLRRCQWSVTREELIKRGIEIPPMPQEPVRAQTEDLHRS